MEEGVPYSAGGRASSFFARSRGKALLQVFSWLRTGKRKEKAPCLGEKHGAHEGG